MGEEVVLVVDNFQTNSSKNYCRICHEAEFESSTKLEAPCSCAGTVKYAHRECIQRWCDEKGDIICEICLKKYEGGYTAIPKKSKKRVAPDDDLVPFREREEVPRREEDFTNEDIECSIISIDTIASYCRRFAIVITVILLLKHLLEVLTGTTHYPFSPATVIILRSCGVIIPMCIIIRIITAFQNSVKQHQNIYEALIRDNYNEEASDVERGV